MTDDPRPAPFLIAEHPALDFLNSVCAPWGDEIEWIGDGGDLLDWMAQAGLILSGEAESLRGKSSDRTLDVVAEEARTLREWFRAFTTAHAGRPLAASALGELDWLNRLLSKDSRTREIVAGTGQAGSEMPFAWRMTRDWKSADDLLFPLAEAMGDLICEVDFSLVKNCEGPTCTMWFVDTSKNHTRRWCSMAVCGNRAKAAAFRARKAERG
ncbi:CGNR zinc finger domain-containing protein [Rhodobacteraceae bacterium NNCM2]|nr:CGNR zinc finger domain-containing protein [Coraliihabitans acroporae]